MRTRRHRSAPRRAGAFATLCAALVVAACGGSAAETPPATDASQLLDDALTARASNEPARFAALVGEAGDACPDQAAALRLSEVAAIADRWAQALADGRPKVQAVTERQLSAVDWATLSDACSAGSAGS